MEDSIEVFVCHLCSRIMEREEDLKYHKTSHIHLQRSEEPYHHTGYGGTLYEEPLSSKKQTIRSNVISRFQKMYPSEGKIFQSIIIDPKTSMYDYCPLNERCEVSFSSETQYQEHLLWHNELKNQWKSVYFNDKETPLQACKTLAGEGQYIKMFRCPVCDVVASGVETMQEHVDTHCSAEEKKERSNIRKKAQPCCYLCSQAFKSWETMESHMETSLHKQRESYVVGTGCDDCLKRLSETALKYHADTQKHMQRMKIILDFQSKHARKGYKSARK